MPPNDVAIPVLPSRSMDDTIAFYARLGFEAGTHAFDSGYAILRRGTVELHFATHDGLVPEESSAGCYIRVGDVDSFHRSCSSAQLPSSVVEAVVGEVESDVDEGQGHAGVAVLRFAPSLNGSGGAARRAF